MLWRRALSPGRSGRGCFFCRWRSSPATWGTSPCLGRPTLVGSRSWSRSSSRRGTGRRRWVWRSRAWRTGRSPACRTRSSASSPASSCRSSGRSAPPCRAPSRCSRRRRRTTAVGRRRRAPAVSRRSCATRSTGPGICNRARALPEAAQAQAPLDGGAEKSCSLSLSGQTRGATVGTRVVRCHASRGPQGEFHLGSAPGSCH
mmetsp:Transcript_35461/g.99153  ORF Transcript_35461/g.99153 Transcript_35461/m.99153 type:complete len:202 (+) Transcript_35461:238-843(+)